MTLLSRIQRRNFLRPWNQHIGMPLSSAAIRGCPLSRTMLPRDNGLQHERLQALEKQHFRSTRSHRQLPLCVGPNLGWRETGRT